MYNIESPKEFATSIGRLRSVSQIRKACERLIEKMKKEGYKDSSISVKLSAYRAAMKGNKAALDALKLDLKTVKQLKKAAATSRISTLKSRRVVDRPHEVMARARQVLNNASYIDRALALVALTGRRPIEVLKCADLYISEDGRLLASGLAKTKGTEAERVVPIVPHHDAQVLVNAWRQLQDEKKFRAKTESQAAAAFNGCTPEGNAAAKRIFSKAMAAKAAKLFGDLVPECKPYDLRKFYALYTYHEFYDATHNEQDAVSELLGHAEGDETTGRSYQSLYLNFKNEK